MNRDDGVLISPDPTDPTFMSVSIMTKIMQDMVNPIACLQKITDRLASQPSRFLGLDICSEVIYQISSEVYFKNETPATNQVYIEYLFYMVKRANPRLFFGKEPYNNTLLEFMSIIHQTVEFVKET